MVTKSQKPRLSATNRDAQAIRSNGFLDSKSEAYVTWRLRLEGDETVAIAQDLSFQARLSVDVIP